MISIIQPQAWYEILLFISNLYLDYVIFTSPIFNVDILIKLSLYYYCPMTFKLFYYDITEILLKVALNTIKPTNNQLNYFRGRISLFNIASLYSFFDWDFYASLCIESRIYVVLIWNPTYCKYNVLLSLCVKLDSLLCFFTFIILSYFLTIWVTCHIRGSNCWSSLSTWIHPWFLVGSVLLVFLVFCVVLHFCVLFVFVLCLVCPMLPLSLDYPFSLMFVY